MFGQLHVARTTRAKSLALTLTIATASETPERKLDIWTSRRLDIWTSAHLDIWTSAHLDIATSAHLDISTSEHLDIRTSGHLVVWTSRHLDIWTSGHLDIWTSAHHNIWTSGHPYICTSGHPNIWTFVAHRSRSRRVLRPSLPSVRISTEGLTPFQSRQWMMTRRSLLPSAARTPFLTQYGYLPGLVGYKGPLS